MGKLIYKPKGAAAEYCAWACNLYNGCTNGCTYCYNKRGVACKLLGKEDVTLKAGLKTKEEVMDRFLRDYRLHADGIHTEGNELFFNFVSDPCLPETIEMNMMCIGLAIRKGINVRLLTKRKEIAEWMSLKDPFSALPSSLYSNLHSKERMRIGFSLTGRDDLEPGASLNSERIAAMKYLSENGFHVWASIEPVINIYDSLCMIASAYRDAGCREFKIGLLSGAKLPYSAKDIRDFYHTVNATWGADCEIMWKQSVRKFIGASAATTTVV